MKTYLITGVAGFIGSAIARKLINNGHTVVGFDNFLTGLKDNIPSEVIFYEIDITQKEQLQKLNEHRFDAVLHLAAQTSGEISFDDPNKDLQINALGTLNILQYSVDRSVNHFIYASSATVYGDPETNPIKEHAQTKPKSYYGITKLTGEQYVRVFSDRLNTTVMRMFNVYGPGQNLDNWKQGMVSIYLRYLIENKPITVKGSGKRFRDFIYIDDVVDAWIAAVQNQKSFGKIYNLSSGSGTTVENLLHSLVSEWGDKEYEIVYTEGTPGDAFGSLGDVSLIKEDLSWCPKTTLDEGIKNTINSVKSISK